MKTLITLSILVLLCSCKTQYTTNYKIETPKGNFYAKDYEIKNDSIYIVEWNNNEIRRKGSFKLNEIKIN